MLNEEREEAIQLLLKHLAPPTLVTTKISVRKQYLAGVNGTEDPAAAAGAPAADAAAGDSGVPGGAAEEAVYSCRAVDLTRPPAHVFSSTLLSPIGLTPLPPTLHGGSTEGSSVGLAPCSCSVCMLPVYALPDQAYLEATVVPLLLRGLEALAQTRPPEALSFLAAYLLSNNPQRHATAVTQLAAGAAATDSGGLMEEAARPVSSVTPSPNVPAAGTSSGGRGGKVDRASSSPGRSVTPPIGELGTADGNVGLTGASAASSLLRHTETGTSAVLPPALTGAPPTFPTPQEIQYRTVFSTQDGWSTPLSELVHQCAREWRARLLDQEELARRMKEMSPSDAQIANGDAELYTNSDEWKDGAPATGPAAIPSSGAAQQQLDGAGANSGQGGTKATDGKAGRKK